MWRVLRVLSTIVAQPARFDLLAGCCSVPIRPIQGSAILTCIEAVVIRAVWLAHTRSALLLVLRVFIVTGRAGWPCQAINFKLSCVMAGCR